MTNHALGGAAAQRIQGIAMAGGGHADEIDLEFDGSVHDRLRDMAVSKNHGRQRA